jgi:alanine dehydrogenase
MLLLDRSDVEAVLDLDALVEAVASAMADLSTGRASMPPRIAAEITERDAILAAMPAYLPSSGALTTKLVSLFPHNEDRPTHQAVVVCFDPSTGTPIALMDGTAITAARTAAGSALATRLLAREEASVLAILGSGVQARSHARAVPRVRPITRVVVADRDPAKAEALAEEVRRELGLAADVAPSFEDATRVADVVCATTHSPDPVVHRDALEPGTHVNSVGFNTAGREVDAATVVDAVLIVESRASALAPPPTGPNEIQWPIRDGLIDASHVRAEIGELVAGTAGGRTSPEEITLYKSGGVAVQDAAAAALVLRAAGERGIGRTFDLETG